MLSLLQERLLAHSRGPRAPRGAVTASVWGAGFVEERSEMRLVYLVVSVLPMLALVTLAAYVIRAVSVRIVWR